MTTSYSFQHSEFTTLVELLQYRAMHQFDHPAFVFLKNGEEEEKSITYGELDRRARLIAARLQYLGATGKRALLLFPPGLDYIASFFGCLYAGVIAVPVYPPRANQSLSRLQAIRLDAQAEIALSTRLIFERVEQLLTQAFDWMSMQWLTTDSLDNGLDCADAAEWHYPELHGETLAFLQYTSGSTSTPKGVMVTHRNLLHNSALICQGFQNGADSRGVIWLPPYHDMGLIGGILQPLYAGTTTVIMSPVDFLQKPIRWLQAISHYRATVSGGPNFAYDLCVQKIPPEKRSVLDLSSWAVAFNGAEPIRADSLERFAEAFAPHGFRREAFYPCYGMAETTLFVSGGNTTTIPTLKTVQADSLSQNQVVVAQENTENTRTLVGCGQISSGMEVAIVHPDDHIRGSSNQVGEIWVAGDSVTLGYWNRPELTENTFHAYLKTGEGPFLRTGDLGFLQDGELFITGRLKDLVIIRGRNYYPQDIELTVELSHPALQRNSGAAFALEVNGEEQLIVVQEVERHHQKWDLDEVVESIRRAVGEHHDLKLYGVLLLRFGSIPKTSSGKIQRYACGKGFLEDNLKVVKRWVLNEDCVPGCDVAGDRSTPIATPPDSPSVAAMQAWLVTYLANYLKLQPGQIDVQSSFASYGLDSRDAVALSSDLENWLKRELPATLAYDYPSIAALSRYLAGECRAETNQPTASQITAEPIAIIGIGCRFPGAQTVEEFWQLLHQGKDAVTSIPADRWQFQTFQRVGNSQQSYWGGFLNQVDQFEPSFFSISPREAVRMDPQQRLLLEVVWEAMEYAGLLPSGLAGSQTGVFVGISSSDFAEFQSRTGDDTSIYAVTGNSHSIAANRLSYLLDLRGPSLAVDTACSSSLVAVHLACQSLRTGECQTAFAAGVNLILSPALTTGFSQAGMIAPDGHCKTFSDDADGYVRGEGCGVVILKRLSDAVRDGNQVLALIRGSAVNQDGLSNGLTAPNGTAQQAVIRQAWQNAGVMPNQISYVEAHGTGTALGDPIELNALKAVLLQERSLEQWCAIGSVKTNIGHLEAAAGIAGLIKVVLSLQHNEIPAHLHFNQLNPLISLAETSLLIPTTARVWRGQTPRIAAVSSFSFGGTNAHVVVEQSTASFVSGEVERSWHLLVLSAKTQAALGAAATNLSSYLRRHPHLNLADVTYTLQMGRSEFHYRHTILCKNLEDAVQALAAADIGTQRLLSDDMRTVVFLFPGQGTQQIWMAQEVYRSEPLFRQTFDRCCELLKPHLNLDLRQIVYPSEGEAEFASQQLEQTALAQPALFVVEYALAQLWISWGVRPAAMLGHSVGEYVAACLAGVFSLEEALALVSVRGRLMQQLPPGDMLSIALSPSDVRPMLTSDLALAAHNAPELCVVAGAPTAIDDLKERLQQAGIAYTPLHTSHAFHSPMMQPILADFREQVNRINLQAPQIPYLSNLTGAWITSEAATNSDYWAAHLRQPVRFAEGMQTLLADPRRILLEVGPGQTLTILAKRNATTSNAPILPSLRRSGAAQSDTEVLFTALGQLWLQGVTVDWTGVNQGYKRPCIPLPTYPFQRERYWIDTPVTRVEPQSPDEWEAIPTVLVTADGMINQISDVTVSRDITKSNGTAKRPLNGHFSEIRDGYSNGNGSRSENLIESGNDSRAISTALHPRPSLKQEYVAPTSPVEHSLAAIWQEVLGLQAIGIYDNFFELGGDSILGTQIAAKANNAGLPLSPVDLFQQPTIAQLAAIATTPSAQPSLNGAAIPAGLTDTVLSAQNCYRLSPMQQGLLFHSLYSGTSGMYLEQFCWQHQGTLNLSVWQQAWQRVVEQHTILRTGFYWKDSEQPYQVVSNQVQLPWIEQDWRHLSRAEQEQQLEILLINERAKGFDFSQPPLMRFTLIQMADETYQFVWSMHHIIMDGWSGGVLLQEVFELYRAIAVGQNVSLPSSRPYSDYVQWLEQQDPASAETFWRSYLQGFTAPTQLRIEQTPTYLLSPTEEYAWKEIHLSAEFTATLQQFARTHRLTLNTLVQGAWALLLSRYSGEEDVVFGATSSGRPVTLRGAEAMVGLFINTLPVRVMVSPEASLLEWLQALQTQQVKARQYEFASLVQIQDWSEVPKSMQLFESIVLFENFPVEALQQQHEDFSLANFRVVSQEYATNYPLNLIVYPLTQLSLRLLYNRRCLGADAVVRLLGHLQTLLEQFVTVVDRPVSSIPMLTEAEQQQLLMQWNSTAAFYPQKICIHQHVGNWAAQTPDAIALVCGSQVLTYRELNQRANQLAHYLQSRGVGPEVLVGVYMQRSPEMVIALLAILKAGGAYVPIDVAYPFERIAFMLEDCQAPVLLTQSHLLDVLPSYWGLVVCMDTDWDQIAQEADGETDSAVTTANLAYVIYTSGSTGKPKGVMVPHQGLLNLCFWHQRTFEVTASDRATHLAGTAFDASVWELWPYLSAGASLYLIKPDTLTSAQRLQRWLVKEGITISFLPTPLAETLLQMDWSQEIALRILLTGGDRLSLYPSANLPFQLVNNYGPTENTVVTTSGVVPHSTEAERAPSIGRAIANTKVYILDRHLQLVPIGIPGELYVSGDGLARGYLNRSELTAERFIPNPFASHQESGIQQEQASSSTLSPRLYKTGDLVRYRDDGEIEYLGRIDDQVKIRGFRIELGEIQAVLSSHPSIQSALVIVREGTTTEKRLVAYVVLHHNHSLSSHNLRSYLKRTLPDYMVPAGIVFLDALPLTPNGKVDRRALLTLDEVSHNPPQTIVLPRDSVEQQLSTLWEQVLNVRAISVTDDFFELGGHSLLAARLIDLIQQQFGRELPISALFEGATIEQLANHLRKPISSSSCAVVIQSGNTHPPIFCIHPGSGNPHCYDGLAGYLNSDQPIYQLQSFGWTDDVAFSSVEAIAERYVEELRSIQPVGAYYLIGWSLGGVIAFEVAQQLKNQGQEIALLGLLDTWAPLPWLVSLEVDDAMLAVLLAKELSVRMGKPFELSYDKLAQLQTEQQLDYFLEQAKQMELVPPDEELSQIQSLLHRYRSNLQTVLDYTPKPYTGTINLFRAETEIAREFGSLFNLLSTVYQKPALGWDEYAQIPVQVFTIPGDHYTMLSNPQVQVLAKRFNNCLDRALKATYPTSSR